MRIRKKQRTTTFSAEDEALIARAIQLRNPVRDIELPQLTFNPAEIRAEAERQSGLKSALGRLGPTATTIATVNVDTDGQVPDDAALTIHSITIPLPRRGSITIPLPHGGALPRGGTSRVAMHRIATALDRRGYQLTPDGLAHTLRSTDALAFLVSRKPAPRLRIVGQRTT